MKAQTIIILLAILLVACTPAVTLVSTETSPPTTLSPTAEVIATMTPSPMPAQPTFAAITPDAIQVEGWKEYQSALAKRLMSDLPPEEVLCEWEILGQSIQTIYVWAVCQGPLQGARMDFTAISVPAVIHLEKDGSIQSVEFPSAHAYGTGAISKMFPPDVREKFSYYNFGGAKKLSEHIEWRREHPGEPPWIVLSATPTNMPATASGNQSGNASVEQQEEIKSFIQTYFEVRYRALSVAYSDDFKQHGFGNLVSAIPEAKPFLQTELAKLAVDIKHAELDHLRYVDYKYSLNFRSIVIDPPSKMATVSVVEDNEVIYEISAELNPENPIVSRTANIEHTIALHEEQGQWHIVSDDYNDDLWRMLRGEGRTTDEILRKLDELLHTMKASPKPTAQGNNTTMPMLRVVNRLPMSLPGRYMVPTENLSSGCKRAFS